MPQESTRKPVVESKSPSLGVGMGKGLQTLLEGVKWNLGGREGPGPRDKGYKGSPDIGVSLRKLIMPEKEVPPDPFDVEANAAQAVSYADLVPEYADKLKKFMGMVGENAQQLKKDLTWTPLPSGPEVWEEGKKKNGENFLKEKGAEMATDLLQTTSPVLAIAGIMAGKKGMSRLSKLKEEGKFTSKFFGDRYEFNPPEELVTKAKTGELDKRIKGLYDKKENLYKEKDALLDSLPDDIYTKDFEIDITKIPKDKAKKLESVYDELDSLQKTTVGDVIKKDEYPDLAQAYPEIFDMPFDVYSKADKTGASYFPDKSGRIRFNVATNKNQSTLEALSHEFQHGVQDIESKTGQLDRVFTQELYRQRKAVKNSGGNVDRDIPFEKEAYESGMRDAYPMLRGMPIETASKNSDDVLSQEQMDALLEIDYAKFPVKE